METVNQPVAAEVSPEERIKQIQLEYNDVCARLGELTFHYDFQKAQLNATLLKLQQEAQAIESAVNEEG